MRAELDSLITVLLRKVGEEEFNFDYADEVLKALMSEKNEVDNAVTMVESIIRMRGGKPITDRTRTYVVV